MKRIILILAAFILFSVDGICQNYYKKYGVRELNQLTQDQLIKELEWNKKAIGISIGALAVGTSLIFLGSYLYNEAKTTEDPFALPFLIVLGVSCIISGSVIDLCGIVMIPYSIQQIDKIKKLLENSEVKLGFINNPTDIMYNRSNMLLTPGISLTINF